MCVILHALKKKHVKRAEIAQAMKSNNSGFAMFALRPGGVRESIRTLDEKELLDFFDKKVKADDEIAMHARIPSRGVKNLDNVHGWEEDKVVFMHNMTITDVDGMMRDDKWNGTDSEYFFRTLFMPMYRRWGAEAYKDGQLHPYIDRMVRFFAGTSNKFLFIMPDNRVLRYGSWVNEPDRKEGDQIAFWASNSTYRVYERTWTPAGGTKSSRRSTGTSYAGFCSGDDDDEREYMEYYGYGYGRQTTADAKATPVKFDGSYLQECVPLARIVRTGLKLHVLSNATGNRALALADLAENISMTKNLSALAVAGMKFAVEGTGDSLVKAANPCAGVPAGKVHGDLDHLLAWYDTWAAALEKYLECDESRFVTRYVHMGKTALAETLDKFDDRLDAALASCDCSIDFAQEEPERAICAFVPVISRRRNRTMAKARLSDLITPKDSTDEEARASVKGLLALARDLDRFEDGQAPVEIDKKGSAA